ncbi:hypothetical protein SAMN02745857_01038 [Andreprevotia lacus DSM 23236]|uniref:Uncharacterized protein n=1 Tax=Andreprevotia lacus DSM 23236 TaxID=1121001 RepID=A0A1W1X9X7_9NEIS|nr:hypothetical protein [Andreprevotia lacus]SMC20752.1 hypothetical protein SAMN02745857_01038 [Andreprevotia lacus DSM 23236]
MKKCFALGLLLLCGLMSNASAMEIRYYQVYTGGGQSYCDWVWPGSEYFGVRQGSGPYYYVACKK